MNSKRVAVIVLVTVLTGAIAIPDTPGKDPDESASTLTQVFEPTESALSADAEVREKLRKVVPEVKLQNMAFEKAIDYLRVMAGLNIIVKTQALQAAGLDPALMEVDLRLSNVTVEKLLQLILEASGAIPLAYVVDEGVITISTKDDLKIPGPEELMDRRAIEFRRRTAKQTETKLELLERMEQTSFEPARVAMIAIGGLKSDVRRKPSEIIDDLEKQLSKTKTLGLRNAIRLTLKDLYRVEGKDEKVLEHLREMLAENDKALQASGRRGANALNAPLRLR